MSTLISSISVVGKTGYRLFSLPTVDKLEEIYAKENEETKIVERLFGSSLVVIVTTAKPNSLKMLHFKKKLDICNCVYPSDILSVRMNRQRLVVCLADSLHIHDIRDMKILHSIENVCPNELGTFALSLNSHLAYPISTTSGELKIFNAKKMKPVIVIKAHETQLSALSFSLNGNLLATASERGTVIRLFCTQNGHKVHEFRRGVKRCVRIASLIFSGCGDYLCASSNTETVHIFKINQKAVEAIERRSIINSKTSNNDNNNYSSKTTNVTAPSDQKSDSNTTTSNNPSTSSETENNSKSTDYDDYESTWSGYLTKTLTSYLPNPMYDVFNQDRAYATAQLPQPNLRHVCGLTKIEKELKLLVACEDGFLYIYDFCDTQGGQCKMIKVHDLRYPLEDVIELTLNDGSPIRVRNASPLKQITYANILRGTTDHTMTGEYSDKYRNLCDAIDTPAKIFDDVQFPPVTTACE
ncbi:WD repeat domain phosphoinositide-interacting protein 1 [Condylostylus longicornis]|uniref:WD repeat domain phosphoinositide-interacting protein 1 n=1 Tax=Condylostylus longicornis TaxID=2530218 RepID=UPI00244DDE73|nr:WD repeat domain phosphoinositide-interacting protein 1 [Condylostylus longicornis]